MANSEILSSILGIITIILAIVSLFLNSKNSSNEKKLLKLKEYAKETIVTECIYQDIVLMGPRNAGKTSVIELWTKPWYDVLPYKHTDDWSEYEANIFEIGIKKKYDNLFEVEREYKEVLRIKVLDCPGEDTYRNLAINKLPELKRATVLLFFDINGDGSIPTEKNNSYYNKLFLDSIESKKGLEKAISKVIVVFNKIDLLPQEFCLNSTSIIKYLREQNKESDNRINSLFSDRLEYIPISALANTGLITLLGSASSVGLPKQEQEKFKVALKKLFEENKPKT